MLFWCQNIPRKNFKVFTHNLNFQILSNIFCFGLFEICSHQRHKIPFATAPDPAVELTALLDLLAGFGHGEKLMEKNRKERKGTP